MIENTCFLKALRCANEEPAPVWLMRQAGRYLPEYRELRKKFTLEQMFRTPSLATEVTMQPLRRFELDAAILFADILTPCEGFGLKATFTDGPKVDGIKSAFHIERLAHVKEIIGRLKQKLRVPLIGFCGGPLTISKYLHTHVSMEELTEAMIQYLRMQIEAGVDAVQIFDSWAGLLPEADFKQRACPYLKQLVDAIRPFPTIVFTRGACRHIDALVALEPTAIGFDWELPMSEIRKKVPNHIAVQGNLDPEVLKQPLEQIRQKVQSLLLSMEKEPGFIFNVGHGLTPDISVGAVECLVKQSLLARR